MPFWNQCPSLKSNLFYPREIHLIHNLKKRQQHIANYNNVLPEKLLKQQLKMQNVIINIVIKKRKEILMNRALAEMIGLYVFVKQAKVS